ncbi:hypothetical protein CAPTEDRAFT_194669 [Capitella teleta]|uniref:Uncharacterized protein n=1 Tax=Capitella teleta TaxID=283909 RepID=R7VIX3_CAPTE|nr:hypothetical protein CAPTEDRAFT_194669 [Capitella teleta]|eukprot:ELU18579.1 hypothetical protein CAPTEDRAFT_194669 [Capitella teleta]
MSKHDFSNKNSADWSPTEIPIISRSKAGILCEYSHANYFQVRMAIEVTYGGIPYGRVLVHLGSLRDTVEQHSLFFAKTDEIQVTRDRYRIVLGLHDRRDLSQGTSPLVNVLQKAEIDVITQEQCKVKWTKLVGDNHICVQNGKTNACAGCSFIQ